MSLIAMLLLVCHGLYYYYYYYYYLLRQKAATYATYTEKLQIQIKTHTIHIKADKTTNMQPLML